MDVPQKQPAPPPEDKRNAIQKNSAAAGCLSVIVLITAVCMICLINNVPLNYCLRTQVCLDHMRSFAAVFLISILIFWVVVRSRLIGWTLLVIGFVSWSLWLLSFARQPDKVSKMLACQEKMRNIYRVIQEYCNGNDNWYPSSLERLIELKRLKPEEVHCPGCKWHNPGDIDYLYYGAGVRRDRQDDKDVLLKEKEKNHQMVSKDCITFEGRLVRSVTGPQDDWGSDEDKRYFKDGKIVKTWQDGEK